MLDTDEGARYIGEFSLGFNPYILQPMKDILFDEKIAGSLHFTPGQAYEDADNGNRSQVHWDLVLIQRPEYGGGEIWFDDELIRKDGRFVVPELGLNPPRPAPRTNGPPPEPNKEDPGPGRKSWVVGDPERGGGLGPLPGARSAGRSPGRGQDLGIRMGEGDSRHRLGRAPSPHLICDFLQDRRNLRRKGPRPRMEAYHGLLAMREELDALHQRLAGIAPDDPELEHSARAPGELQHHLELDDEHTLEPEARRVLSGLGFSRATRTGRSPSSRAAGACAPHSPHCS